MPDFVTEGQEEEVTTSLVQGLTEGEEDGVDSAGDVLDSLSGIEVGLAVALGITGLVAACGVAR